MTYKKLLPALLLVLALTMSLCAPAFADSAEYSTTEEFLSYLDRKSSKYEYELRGIDDDDEVVVITTDTDNMGEIMLKMFFAESEDRVTICFWNVIDFNSYNHDAVLEVVNDLNYNYKWIKMFIDPSDNSVSVYADLVIRPGSCGKPVYDAMRYLVLVTDSVFEELEPYNK